MPLFGPSFLVLHSQLFSRPRASLAMRNVERRIYRAVRKRTQTCNCWDIQNDGANLHDFWHTWTSFCSEHVR